MAAANQERRAFQRYALQNPDFFYVTSADSQRWHIADLSYGGVGVMKSQASQSFDKDLPQGELLPVTLGLLGRESVAHIKPRRLSSGLLGCEFSHSSGETLLFLRGVLEYLRIGQSLEQIPKKFLKERFQGTHWQCYRGDGPSDLFFEKDTQDFPHTVLLTFRSGRDYCDVVFQDGKLMARKSADPSSADSLAVARMSDLEGSEGAEVFRWALAILLGFLKGEHLDLWQPLLGALWGKIGV